MVETRNYSSPDISRRLGEPIVNPINIVSINHLRVDLATRCDMGVRTRRETQHRKQHPGIVITTPPEHVAKILGVPFESGPSKREWKLAARHLGSIASKLNGTRTEEEDAQINRLLEGLTDPDRQAESIVKVEKWYASLFPEGRNSTIVFEENPA